MPVLNEKAIYDLKWHYNHNLNRYYNGCNYLEKNPEKFDKYIGELKEIEGTLEILLTEIEKQQKVTESERLDGFILGEK